jgi:sugar phosphate permease
MPIYLQQSRHLSEKQMKYATSCLFLAGIAGPLLAGVMSDWLVKKKGLLMGRRLMGVGSLGAISLCFFTAALIGDRSSFISRCFPMGGH